MRAAEQGCTDIVRILLEHGADINTKSDLGELHTITLSQYLPLHPSIYIQLFIYICVYLNSYNYCCNSVM